MSRLVRALELFERLQGTPDPEERARLRSAHQDLDDLLAPMLAAEIANTDEPQRLGDFVLVREIGRGGMGVVYEAQQLSLDRRVALKVLPIDLDSTPKAVARFKREAQTIARLEHPGIVRVLAVGDEVGRHWFAMELVDGAPPTAGLPLQTAVRIAAEIAEALDHAHNAGVVHRDVKPGNILVRRDGRAVLTDFGLSLERDLPSMTRSGALLGTPDYLSPEQARGLDVDAQSDVFALGVTLYELLTGTRPFAAPTTHAIVHAILTRDPQDPRSAIPHLPGDLSAIVMKALEKDRSDRYHSAAALAADLRAFLEYRPVTARRARTLQKLRRWIKREPAKAALSALLALVLPAALILAGYLLGHAQDLRAGALERKRDELASLIATSFMRTVAADSPAVERELEARLADFPDDAELWTTIAMAYVSEGAYADATRLVDQHAAHPDAGPICSRIRAWILEDQGRGGEAASLRATLGAPQSQAELLVDGVHAIRAFRTTGDTEALRIAGEQLGRAIALSPRPSLVLFDARASAAYTAEDRATVALCAEAMSRHWPNEILTSYWRGMAAIGSDLQAAAFQFEHVIALSPNMRPVPALLAGIKIQLGDLEAARSLLERAMAATPDDDATQSSLGLLDFKTERFAEARQHFERAVALAPGIWQHRYHLGLLHNEGGHAQRALPSLERAAQLNPREPEVHYQLAVAWLALSSHEKALSELETVLKLRPGDRSAENGVAMLHRAMAASHPTSR